MARRGRPKKREVTIQSNETKNVIGILSLIAAALIILSYVVDAPGFDLISKYLGQTSIVAFVFFTNLALRMFRVNYPLSKTKSVIGQLLLTISASGFLHLFVTSKEAEAVARAGESGGILGYTISHVYLIDIFAREGSFIILAFFVFTSITLTLSISVSQIFQFLSKLGEKVGGFFQSINQKMAERQEKSLEKKKQKAEEEKNAEEMTPEEKMIGDLREKEKQLQQEEPQSPEIDEEDEATEPDISDGPVVKVEEDLLEGALVNKSLNYNNWTLPSTSLLDPRKTSRHQDPNVKKNADIIEQTLQSFGVKARVVDAVVGPTVTQYAINIALGTRSSRIMNLKTDLALALAAPTGSVRIVAPIPGTSYIGIEIPNAQKDTVFIRELLESEEMKKNSMQLPACVGKSISGENIITDLQKMPHLLVAGATGSGKSVLTNAFIVSLLMKKSPDEVRMIMVDPKQVELSDYNGIPHLLIPVITDMQKVLNALKWAIVEMEKRYTIFNHAHVRNIETYNEKMGFSAMPYILILIDEMADLMLSSGAEVETAIVKLAQKARATGIHLILATQRPSVDVITGLIKANIPGRVGMSVATQVDSRVILDQVGAETLLGKGDMLFKEPDKAKPFRVQGVWVSQKEIRRVVKFIKTQAKEVHYSPEIIDRQPDPGASQGAIESVKFSDDEHFADAVRIVCNSKKGSASLLQRKLSIGYNRAARLLDEMQKHGVVGPAEGSKPRKVLISDPEAFLEGAQRESEGSS